MEVWCSYTLVLFWPRWDQHRLYNNKWLITKAKLQYKTTLIKTVQWYLIATRGLHCIFINTKKVIAQPKWWTLTFSIFGSRMVLPCSSITINRNMNEGDQNNIDTNSSEIKHVTTSLTTTALPASTSNTLNLKSSIKSCSATVPHSPTITASRHKDEEKKIQMVRNIINRMKSCIKTLRVVMYTY